MSKRNDMITRMVFLYKLRLRFFDTEDRKETETFVERYSRKDEADTIMDEFRKWSGMGPFILTGVDVLSAERILFGMTPERFYEQADELERVVISDSDRD